MRKNNQMMGTYKTCKIRLVPKSDSCVILAKYKPVSGINMNLATQRVSFLIYREAVSGENTKEVNVCACVGKQELDAVHSRCSGLGPVRYMTISVHTTSVQVFRQIRNLDHFGTCITSVCKWSTCCWPYIPLRYIKSLMRCFRPYLAF